jgi:hypothetical protein
VRDDAARGCTFACALTLLSLAIIGLAIVLLVLLT